MFSPILKYFILLILAFPFVSSPHRPKDVVDVFGEERVPDVLFFVQVEI